MKMNRLILASASPRRRELLSLITEDFEIIPSRTDEALPDGMYAAEASEYLARIKCGAVAEKYPDCCVIGADTLVILGQDILGKPKDENDAFHMLKRLSGKTHLVTTGVCVKYGNKTESFTEISEVEFLPLSDEEILNYIRSGEPMDKAGAYGIQEKGALFVKKICGDFNNIVGLPVSRLYRVLKGFKNEL